MGGRAQHCGQIGANWLAAAAFVQVRAVRSPVWTSPEACRGARWVPRAVTEQPVDPVHDDHDQDSEPPTPTGEEPRVEDSDVEDPDPAPGG